MRQHSGTLPAGSGASVFSSPRDAVLANVLVDDPVGEDYVSEIGILEEGCMLRVRWKTGIAKPWFIVRVQP